MEKFPLRGPEIHVLENDTIYAHSYCGLLIIGSHVINHTLSGPL